MKIERFFAYVSSLETGRDEIKKLIEEIKNSEKENEWYFKDITVELNGVLLECLLFRRQFENIENLKLENDQLKINYFDNVRNISVEVSKKGTNISIPINLINTIKVELK